MEFRSQEEVNQYLSDRLNMLTAQNIALTTAFNAMRAVLSEIGGFGPIDMVELMNKLADTADSTASSEARPELKRLYSDQAAHLRQMASFGQSDESKSSPIFVVIKGGVSED